MANRREFLALGIVASAGTLLSLPGLSATGTGASAAINSFPMYKILYDPGYDQSLPAAHSLMRRLSSGTTPLVAVGGDITRFWYDDLSEAWRRYPQPIAGVTAASALFCLEQLARDYRMRVIRREQLTAGRGNADDALVSWVIAGADRKVT